MKQGEYITSDTHFGHTNIIKYSNRPFENVDEMNEQLIARWNAKIPPGSIVYHLGDFAFMKREDRIIELAKRLNGTIRLVMGNHDRLKGKVRDCFEWVRPYYESKTDDGIKVTMCHYPFMTWNKSHRNSWSLHGHCHGNLQTYPNMIAEMLASKGFDEASLLVLAEFGTEPRRLDVGVDTNNYEPYSFDEIKAIMETRGHVVIDHHE
jgi:calcineurin-like phosphoesterase family protein